MKRYSLIISTGFAMFSMFFGSGNLVFPLLVGKEADGHFLMAALGIILTGVLVPFMGVGAMLMYKGNSRAFFGTLGKYATFWLPLLILGLMGPFGVLARCLTVAHGSFRLLIPDAPLWLFSLVCCFLIYAATVNKSRIVPILGKWLTPFLLLSLFSIALFGYWNWTPVAGSETPWQPALTNGVYMGYQMMDLLASFFFSAFILKHIQEHACQESMVKVFIKSSLIGAFLLSCVYCGLIFLGSAYSSSLNGVAPQEMLGLIAASALGSVSAPIVCVAVVLACFTTAVVLATLFSDFLHKEVAKEQVSTRWTMLITLGIAFGVSTLDFAGIASFLGPIVETMYPALIVLTLYNIALKLVRKQPVTT